ncbi:MAG: DUF58 domain-containing protein, partial [Dokdonia sp.]|nr:DUF58 domain-containing protein [Dokdonia sp.]
MVIIRFIKSLYLHPRFFYALTTVAFLFLASYWFNALYPVAWMAFWALWLLFFFDCVLLFKGQQPIAAKRLLPEKFSNSDENALTVNIRNHYPFKIDLTIIDEIPVQFQKRDFFKKIHIPAKESKSFSYDLRPVDRGEYVFGNLNVYASSRYGIVKRRFTFEKDQMVKVYPSFIQMKKYAFLALDNRLTLMGMKKMRRIGHTMEFEQIKDYVLGDDVRTINWKATAKHGNLMINQFQDEKSQPIYCLIDASRSMKMPFKGLS